MHPARIALLVIATTLCFFSCARAEPIRLGASALNNDAYFAKFMFSFPIPSGSAFHGLTGSAKIISQGQGFSQALLRVEYIPAGAACPKNGEKYSSYETIRSKYPTMKPLVGLIVKQPYGSRESSVTPNITLPVGVPINGCIVVILDGSVRRVGGPFKMISALVADIQAAKPTDDASVLPLDDEFCFGIAKGCQIATLRGSPDAAFIRVINAQTPLQILGLYGDVSASVLQGSPAYEPTQIAWSLENTYIIRPRCGIADGDHGPQDFHQKFSDGSKILYSVQTKGKGRTALTAAISKTFPPVQVQAGDCLVHMVRSTDTGTLGGVDAENQIYMLTRGSAP